MTSDQTIRSIAGHVSEKMLEHYSHIRLDAKRSALNALSSRGKAEGYGTNDDTNTDTGSQAKLQVVENMVDVAGLEPAASSLRTRRSPN